MDPVIIVTFFGLSIASFALGWNVAENRERKAKKILDANLRLAIRQKNDLTSWIRENWPNEYAAHQNGHMAGYQQGVLDAPLLEDTE